MEEAIKTLYSQSQWESKIFENYVRGTLFLEELLLSKNKKMQSTTRVEPWSVFLSEAAAYIFRRLLPQESQ